MKAGTVRGSEGVIGCIEMGRSPALSSDGLDDVVGGSGGGLSLWDWPYSRRKRDIALDVLAMY